MNNTEKRRQLWQQWYAENREAVLASKRERYRTKGGKEKSKQEARLRRSRAPARVLGYQRKFRYGITPEQFDQMFEAQGRRCAICPATEPGFRGWCVDHCHTTNKVRGVCCRKCNLMLGYARDDTSILSAAIDYLKR